MESLLTIVNAPVNDPLTFKSQLPLLYDTTTMETCKTDLSNSDSNPDV